MTKIIKNYDLQPASVHISVANSIRGWVDNEVWTNVRQPVHSITRIQLMINQDLMNGLFE